MGLNCSICAHNRRKEIDKALVGPKPNFSAIARIYSADRGALKRHLEGGHVEEKIKKAADAQEALDADDLLSEFMEVQTQQKIIYKEARTRKIKVKKDDGTIGDIVVPDNKLALEALRDRAKTLEFKGKIQGAFKADKGGTGNNPLLPGSSLITPLPPEAARKIGDIIAGNI